MKLGKPCRRGRRRSQVCPPTMTVSAPENSRCPPRSVSRTERTGTCNHGPSFSGSSAVTLLMPTGFHGSQPGSAGALAGPTRSITRNIRSRLPIGAQAWEVSPGCNQGNPAGEGAGAARDARIVVLPMSAEVRQANRADWNTPTRPVRPGECCSDALDAGRDARGPAAW